MFCVEVSTVFCVEVSTSSVVPPGEEMYLQLDKCTREFFVR